MTEEEALQLRKENQELREALKQTQELLHVALARIEELEKQKTPPPAFIKADVRKPAVEEKKPRKKREAQHNRARRRRLPTQIVEHHLLMCPDCDLRLGGISLARSREVMNQPNFECSVFSFQCSVFSVQRRHHLLRSSCFSLYTKN